MLLGLAISVDAVAHAALPRYLFAVEVEGREVEVTVESEDE